MAYQFCNDFHFNFSNDGNASFIYNSCKLRFRQTVWFVEFNSFKSMVHEKSSGDSLITC